MNKTFPDQFLDALGAWQRGWGEDAIRREVLTENLQNAISVSRLPAEAFVVNETCYRKRFLIKDNPLNGGDFTHLILGNAIPEGIASWTTDFNYAKEFKGPLRPDSLTAIFESRPRQEEIVLNIKCLWGLDEFHAAVVDYSARNGAQAAALLNFKSLQSEVILDASLTFDGIETFCSKSSSFETLCHELGITEESKKNELWKELALNDKLPEEPKWLAKDDAKRVLVNTRRKFLEQRTKS